MQRVISVRIVFTGRRHRENDDAECAEAESPRNDVANLQFASRPGRREEMGRMPDQQRSSADDKFDSSSRPEFFEYYAAESATPEATERLRHVRDIVLKISSDFGKEGRLVVADIGCNAGTSSMLWAEAGHEVIGLDVNEPLIELAKVRARESGFDIDFRVGSATELPLEDGSVDICMAAELLEHVENWEAAVAEFVRILKPGGFLWMTTTNALCPKQQEFNLPFFSWYPGPLKRHYIRRAQTTHPELANYATYPAFNWFTPYELKAHLAQLGVRSMDRFDVAYAYKEPGCVRSVLRTICLVPPLRFLAHVLTPSTTVLGRKLD